MAYVLLTSASSVPKCLRRSESFVQLTMVVNWETQRDIDRDVEENADLYAALADESADE